MISRPTSCLDLLDFPRDQFGFPFPGWEIEFGIYQWFYVSGVRSLLSSARALNRTFVYQSMPKAIRNVPALWKEEFWPGDWDDLAKLQISRVLGGRPVRFDKACIALLCIEYALKEIGSLRGYDGTFGLYNNARIAPAFFIVDRLDAVLVNRSLTREAAVYLGQSTSFVERSARGRSAMTYGTASKMVEFCSSKGFPQCSVRMLMDRTDRGRMVSKTPNPDEAVR